MLPILSVLWIFLTIGFAPTPWPIWEKQPTPVYSGQFMVASDPTVIDEGDFYRMVYTCIDFLRDQPRTTLCQAISSDGLEWQPIDSGEALEGVILRGREGGWDENLEGAYLIKQADEYWLYYSGYRENGVPVKGFPAALALAISTDGVQFERYQAEPILEPTEGWYDHDAIYSPVIVPYNDGWLMIYVGHCYTRCEVGSGITLLAATSEDGIRWEKRPDPVLSAMPDTLPWTRDGLAEPALIIEADGSVTLFFSGVRDSKHTLAMARSVSPYGPWEVSPEPILQPTEGGFDEGGILAPMVLLEAGLARMWYLGVEPVEAGEYYHIGYAEAIWR